ncbi:MAG: hypothetical protein HGB34_04715 [Candidatus Moranbacteria bacterium]|nr:hypothetical protein [Candidatus Moranbacteria bacterium]
MEMTGNDFVKNRPSQWGLFFYLDAIGLDYSLSYYIQCARFPPPFVRGGAGLSFDSFPAAAENGLGTVSDISLLGNILRRSSPDASEIVHSLRSPSFHSVCPAGLSLASHRAVARIGLGTASPFCLLTKSAPAFSP